MDKREAPDSPRTKKMMNGDQWSSAAGLSGAQMHKPLVRDLPVTSVYHQGTEARLLELGRFMAGPDSQTTTHRPPLVFHGSIIIKIQDNG